MAPPPPGRTRCSAWSWSSSTSEPAAELLAALPAFEWVQRHPPRCSASRCALNSCSRCIGSGRPPPAGPAPAPMPHTSPAHGRAPPQLEQHRHRDQPLPPAEVQDGVPARAAAGAARAAGTGARAGRPCRRALGQARARVPSWHRQQRLDSLALCCPSAAPTEARPLGTAGPSTAGEPTACGCQAQFVAIQPIHDPHAPAAARCSCMWRTRPLRPTAATAPGWPTPWWTSGTGTGRWRH
jgi:hypothetical protein